MITSHRASELRAALTRFVIHSRARPGPRHGAAAAGAALELGGLRQQPPGAQPHGLGGAPSRARDGDQEG
jgi:hypothetical protein